MSVVAWIPFIGDMMMSSAHISLLLCRLLYVVLTSKLVLSIASHNHSTHSSPKFLNNNLENSSLPIRVDQRREIHILPPQPLRQAI